MASGAERVILPFPASVTAARAFRSTWIVSSLECLRACGHFERYHAALREYHEEILTCVAAAWLPMVVAKTHYEACESLALTPEEMFALTESGRVRRAWYANLIAFAEKTESPWEVFAQLHRMWLRGADGGAVAVFRLAENQARVEYAGCELFDIPYFRRSVATVLQELAGHVVHDARVEPHPSQPSGAVYRLSWA